MTFIYFSLYFFFFSSYSRLRKLNIEYEHESDEYDPMLNDPTLNFVI